MPRAARKKSKTGVYHIMVRGINRQDIFLDEEDKGVYLDRLARYKKECGLEIYAYCLMSNHIHLLVREGKESISQTMKKIGSSYVYWYNWKYDRVGHLFQDRYKSEPVEDDMYLLTVARYIHQNPVEIGLEIEDWTSYNDYFRNSQIVDREFILEMFNQSEEEFKRYMKDSNEDICLEIGKQKRLTDAEAKNIIKEVGKINTCQELQMCDREIRDRVLKELKNNGLSIRQIERITGINRGIIHKA